MLMVPSQPAQTKRPKLSLQTASLPLTYGKSSTGITMASSAARTASPTILNTFTNAYEIPSRTPSSSRLTRLSPSSRLNSAHTSRHNPSLPYKLPIGLKGILRNTPIPADMRRSSIATSASPCTTRRVFFPPTKQVHFRTNLEEEVRTVRFTITHADIDSDPLLSDDDGASDTDSVSTTESQHEPHTDAYSTRQVEAVALHDRLYRRAPERDDESGFGAFPKTPSISRRARRRWEWTLGPLEERGHGAEAGNKVADGDEEEEDGKAIIVRFVD
jgi:hypothetical protein